MLKSVVTSLYPPIPPSYSSLFINFYREPLSVTWRDREANAFTNCLSFSIIFTAKPGTLYCQTSRNFDLGRSWIMAQKLAATSRTGRDNQRRSSSLCLDHPRQPLGAFGGSKPGLHPMKPINFYQYRLWRWRRTTGCWGGTSVKR